MRPISWQLRSCWQPFPKNFKFSPGKFVISPSVTFARLALRAHQNGEVSILSDPKRVDNLLSLPTPKSREDVLLNWDIGGAAVAHATSRCPIDEE